MTAVIIFIVGLFVGSFLNVVILRLGTNKSMWFGRSQCPQCQTTIAWYDNIPVISFLLLQGKCRNCQQRISNQYISVELITAVSFIWLLDRFGWSTAALVYAVFFCFLIVIFVYDLRHYLILDGVVLPGVLVAAAGSWYLGVSWQSLALGMIIGAGFFAAQFFISGGRWVGGGDIRLGAMMGAMLGWQLLLVALFIAYVVGAAVGLALMAAKQKTMASQIPFGPFLTLATFIALLYGQPILQWYLRSLYL